MELFISFACSYHVYCPLVINTGNAFTKFVNSLSFRTLSTDACLLVFILEKINPDDRSRSLNSCHHLSGYPSNVIYTNCWRFQRELHIDHRLSQQSIVLCCHPWESLISTTHMFLEAMGSSRKFALLSRSHQHRIAFKSS